MTNRPRSIQHTADKAGGVQSVRNSLRLGTGLRSTANDLRIAGASAIQNRPVALMRPNIEQLPAIRCGLPEVKASDLVPKNELMESTITFKGETFPLPTEAGKNVTVGKLTFEFIPTGIWKVRAEDGIKELTYETVLRDGSRKENKVALNDREAFFGFISSSDMNVSYKEGFFSKTETMTVSLPLLLKSGKRSCYQLDSLQTADHNKLYSVPEPDESRLFALGDKHILIGKGTGTESNCGFYNMIGIMLDGKVEPSVHGEQFWGQITGKDSPYAGDVAGPHGPYFVVYSKGSDNAPASFEAGGHEAYLVPNDYAKELMVSAVKEAVTKRIITTERAVEILSKLKTYAEFADRIEKKSTPPPIPSKALSRIYTAPTSAKLAEEMNASSKGYLDGLKEMNNRGLAINGLEVPLSKGAPGGLLKGSTDLKLIYIGDLHGNLDNLDAILSAYGKELGAGKAKLVFLGDVIHPEPHNTEGSIREMSTSITAIDAILKLYAENKAVFLRGDHDTMWKGGVNMPIKNEFVLVKRDKDHKTLVPQVDEFRDQYQRNKRSAYLKENKEATEEEADEHARQCVKELDRFFGNAPLISVIDNVIAGHTPAVNEDALMFLPRFMGFEQLLVEAKHNELEFHLTWSRPRSSDPNIPVYRQEDIVRMKKELGKPERTLFIFGHTQAEFSYAGYKNDGMTGAITLMSSYRDKLTVIEVERGEVSARDLKGQSPLGGLRASIGTSARTGSVPK